MSLSSSDLLKIGFTVLLLSVLAHQALKYDFMVYLQRANIGLMLLAMLAHAVAFGFQFLRWDRVLGAVVPLQGKSHYRSFYIGVASAKILPGTIGGDAVRAVMLKNAGFSLSHILAASLLDRLLGLFVAISMATIAVLLMLDIEQSLGINLKEYVFQALLLFFVLLGLGILAGRQIVKMRFRGWLQFIADCSQAWLEAIESVLQQPLRYSQAFVYSTASTGMVVITYACIAYSIETPVAWLALCVVVPCSFLAASIPLTIGGIGLREGAVVSLLVVFGSSTEHAIAISILYLMVLLLVSLLAGGIAVMMRSPQERVSET